MSLLACDCVGPVPGSNVVYVIVGDRAKFDQIDRPMIDHSTRRTGMRVLSKTVGNPNSSSDEGLVIFQYWINGAGVEREGI
jgi:hypothetical protein